MEEIKVTSVTAVRNELARCWVTTKYGRHRRLADQLLNRAAALMVGTELGRDDDVIYITDLDKNILVEVGRKEVVVSRIQNLIEADWGPLRSISSIDWRPLL